MSRSVRVGLSAGQLRSHLISCCQLSCMLQQQLQRSSSTHRSTRQCINLGSITPTTWRYADPACWCTHSSAGHNLDALGNPGLPILQATQAHAGTRQHCTHICAGCRHDTQLNSSTDTGTKQHDTDGSDYAVQQCHADASKLISLP
jgi:hypothetical protein